MRLQGEISGGPTGEKSARASGATGAIMSDYSKASRFPAQSTIAGTTSTEENGTKVKMTTTTEDVTGVMMTDMTDI